MNMETTALKSFGAFAAAAAATSGVAFAADLPAREMPLAPVMVPNWQGLYVGGHIGASWLNSGIDDTAATPMAWGYGAPAGSKSSANAFGGLGGVQLGYNVQSRNFVFGVEGDFAFLGGGRTSANGSHTTTQAGYYGYTATGQTRKESRVSALGTLRARAGIDFNGTMPYLTAGIAVGQIRNTYSVAITSGYGSGASGSVADKSWTPGFVVGGGIEHQITPHMSVKGEMLWVQFKDKTIAGPDAGGYGGGGPTGTVRFSNHMMVSKIGMNYRF